MSDPTSQIIASMFDLNRVVRHRMMAIDEPGTLNMHQMHTLIVIQEHPRMTMGELAQSLRISLPSATSLINRLVRMKFIERRIDRTNRKMVRLKLSALGEKVLSTKMRSCHREMHKIFSLMPTKDRTEFAHILQSLLIELRATESASSPQ